MWAYCEKDVVSWVVKRVWSVRGCCEKDVVSTGYCQKDVVSNGKVRANVRREWLLSVRNCVGLMNDGHSRK